MSFLTTNTGKRIDLLKDPDPTQFIIEDIAGGLSRICRFNGQISRFYSVAEHSIHVSELLPKHLQLQGLLHDASEAYICDIPTPLKLILGEAYYVIERRIMHGIGLALGVELDNLHPSVKEADRVMTVTERDKLRAARGEPWGPEYENAMRYPHFQVMYNTPTGAADAFIKRFNELKGG